MELAKSNRWLALPLLLILLFFLNLTLGSVSIPLGEILGILVGKTPSNPIWSDIVWDFRMTKALTCILAGGALSIGGLQMQTLFRNALAGPDVLGITSGASLAVAIVMLSRSFGPVFFAAPPPWIVVLSASLGCSLVFLIITMIAQKLRDNTSLLIVGLMVGATASSLVSVLQFISKAEDQKSFLLWTFGTLGRLGWEEIRVLFLILIVGGLIGLFSTKSLNAWLLGNNYAQSLGVNMNRSRVLIIVSTCILTGSVTAFCGPIAFIGLAVPHLTRLIIKTNDHRVLLPSVTFGGGALMLFCDTISQLPGTAYVLPLNAITALIGAPVVVWIILRAKRVFI